MKDEDKNYNLEEDDEDEDFMIGGTNDDLDEEPEEPEGEEEAETRVNKKPERKTTSNNAAGTERTNTKKEKKEIIHDEEEEEDDYDYDDDDDEEENGGKKKIIIIAIIVAAAVAAAGVCTYQKLKGNNEGTHQEQQTAEVTETPTPEADSASEDSDYEEDFGDDSTETDDGADSADADSDSTDEDEDGSTDENDAMPTSTPKPLPTATPIPTDIPNTEEKRSLDEYVEGLDDIEIQLGDDLPSPRVSYDDTKVVSVSLDTSKVDKNTIGVYTISYIIKGVDGTTKIVNKQCAVSEDPVLKELRKQMCEKAGEIEKGKFTEKDFKSKWDEAVKAAKAEINKKKNEEEMQAVLDKLTETAASILNDQQLYVTKNGYVGEMYSKFESMEFVTDAQKNHYMRQHRLPHT